MLKTIFLGVLVLGLHGCTVIRHDAFWYCSVLQEKSLTITGNDSQGQSLELNYSSNSDPAIEAFKQGLATGMSAAGAASAKEQ